MFSNKNVSKSFGGAGDEAVAEDEYDRMIASYNDYTDRLLSPLSEQELRQLKSDIDRDYQIVCSHADAGDVDFEMLRDMFIELYTYPQMNNIKILDVLNIDDLKTPLELETAKFKIIEVIEKQPSHKQQAEEALQKLYTKLNSLLRPEVFPYTDISLSEEINPATETRILETYKYIYPIVDPITFKKLPEFIDKHKSKDSAHRNPPFDDRLFISVLIRAAAENLKSNKSKEIQSLNNITSAIIVGDIHGDLPSLFIIFHKCIETLKSYPNTCIIFLGDYVDRGIGNMDVIFILACLKMKFPNRIFLLRGNHEISSSFWEYINPYGRNMLSNLIERTTNPYDTYMAYSIFISSLSLITILNQKTVCVHGGIVKGTLDVNLPIKFLPRISYYDSEFCVLNTDYPNIERNQDKCFGIMNVDEFNNELSKHGYDSYFKGHCHTGANNYTYAHNINKYIVVSSRYILNIQCVPQGGKRAPGRTTFEETADGRIIKNIQSETDVKRGIDMVNQHTTIIHVNGGVVQPILVIEPNCDDIYANLVGYCREFYHDSYLMMCQKMMQDAVLEYNPETHLYDNCDVLHELEKMLR